MVTMQTLMLLLSGPQRRRSTPADLGCSEASTSGENHGQPPFSGARSPQRRDRWHRANRFITARTGTELMLHARAQWFHAAMSSPKKPQEARPNHRTRIPSLRLSPSPTPSLQVPASDQVLVDQLLYLCRLAADVHQVVGGELISQGLSLVTTSAICESIKASSVVATVSEDYEAGDGMVVPLADVRRQSMAGGCSSAVPYAILAVQCRALGLPWLLWCDAG
jgi:hypothetical protein